MSHHKTLLLEVVTPEGVAYTDQVNMVIAPGSEGELGILPGHISLVTRLKPGFLRAKKRDEKDNFGDELRMEILGGFLEIRPDKVIVLTDVPGKTESVDLDKQFWLS